MDKPMLPGRGLQARIENQPGDGRRAVFKDKVFTSPLSRSERKRFREAAGFFILELEAQANAELAAAGIGGACVRGATAKPIIFHEVGRGKFLALQIRFDVDAAEETEQIPKLEWYAISVNVPATLIAATRVARILEGLDYSVAVAESKALNYEHEVSRIKRALSGLRETFASHEEFGRIDGYFHRSFEKGRGRGVESPERIHEVSLARIVEIFTRSACIRLQRLIDRIDAANTRTREMRNTDRPDTKPMERLVADLEAFRDTYMGSSDIVYFRRDFERLCTVHLGPKA